MCSSDLPLTASISYAAADDPKSATLETSLATELGGAMRDAKAKGAGVPDFVVVDVKKGADPKDPRLQTRVVEKDGKTIVIKTAKPLTDAEVQEHITKAEASMKDTEAMVWTSKDKDADGKHKTITMIRRSSGDGPTEERKRVIVMSGDSVVIDGDSAASMLSFHNKDGKSGAMAFVADGNLIACAAGGEGSNVAEEEVKDGKRQTVKMRFCSKGAGPAMALEAMKKARERMGENKELSSEMKEKILKSLDEQIEKMSKQG